MCASLPYLEQVVVIEQGEVARTTFVGSYEILPITNQVIPCPLTQRALPLASYTPCMPYPLKAMPLASHAPCKPCPLQAMPLASHSLESCAPCKPRPWKLCPLPRPEKKGSGQTAIIKWSLYQCLCRMYPSSWTIWQCSAPTCQLQAVWHRLSFGPGIPTIHLLYSVHML